MFDDHDEYHHEERGEILDDRALAYVRRRRTTVGVTEAAREIGLSINAFSRAAAGFPVYRPTVVKILAAMAKESR